MKIYLVQMHIDENSHVKKAFHTYLDASQWLIKDGFEPYLDWWFGESKVGFCSEEDDYFIEATIIEMEVEECL